MLAALDALQQKRVVGVLGDLQERRDRRQQVRDAAAAGCQALGGLEMLVAQAEEQFRWWMDGKPPRGVMRDAATKRLAEFTRDENYVL